MVTISNVVKSQIRSSNFLQECLLKDIVSYGNLAERLQPLVEKEIGYKVNLSAIVMALRRFAEVLRKRSVKQFDKKIVKDISMSTNIVDLCCKRSKENFLKLQKYTVSINPELGEFANCITGDHELVLITNHADHGKIKSLVNKSELRTFETSLVSISIRFLPKFLHTPGVIYSILREIAWFDLNIYEVISTNSELILIFKKEHALKAFSLISDFVDRR